MNLLIKSAAKSSNARPAPKRAEDLLNPDEISEMFKVEDPGMVTVLGKFAVTPMIYQHVAYAIDTNSRSLIAGEQYTANELIEDQYWLGFGPEGQREMQLCLKHFAAHPDSKLVDLNNGMFKRA